MRFSYIARRNLVGAIAAFVTAISGAAFADTLDYRFELVTAQSAGLNKTNVAIRLVHVPDKKPVTDAVVTETRADMGPSGMKEMTGKVTPQASDRPAVYRFQTETGMAGIWALSLAATVPGEKETIRGSINFKAEQ